MFLSNFHEDVHEMESTGVEDMAKLLFLMQPKASCRYGGISNLVVQKCFFVIVLVMKCS